MSEEELRDLAAVFAMFALIVKSPAVDVAADDESLEECMAVATGAYDYADAMVEARK